MLFYCQFLLNFQGASALIQMRSLSDLDVNNGIFAEEGATVISFVDIDSGEYRRKIDTKTVRKNVTIPGWLNYEAEHAGINVSRVLQEALMKVLNVQRNF